MKALNQILFVGSILFLFLQESCVPIFSELQSARTVGKDNFDITPSYSSVKFSEDGDSDQVQSHIGLQVAYGLSDKVDLRARLERIWLDEENLGDGVDVLGIGPKISLVKDKVAFYVPIGTAINQNTEWQIHPTFLFTLPIAEDRVEVTLSPKYLIGLCKGCEGLIAVNLGFSLSNDLSKWAIRPEYGHLYDLNESGYYNHFSIGFSRSFGQ